MNTLRKSPSELSPASAKKNRERYAAAREGIPAFEPLTSEEPPKELEEAVQLAWREIVPLLSAKKVLTNADVPSLIVMCQTLADYHTMRRQVAEEGYTIEGQHGPVRHPLLNIIMAARTALLHYFNSFGMTPSARSKVRLPAELEKIVKQESIADI